MQGTRRAAPGEGTTGHRGLVRSLLQPIGMSAEGVGGAGNSQGTNGTNGTGGAGSTSEASAADSRDSASVDSAVGDVSDAEVASAADDVTDAADGYEAEAAKEAAEAEAAAEVAEEQAAELCIGTTDECKKQFERTQPERDMRNLDGDFLHDPTNLTPSQVRGLEALSKQEHLSDRARQAIEGFLEDHRNGVDRLDMNGQIGRPDAPRSIPRADGNVI